MAREKFGNTWWGQQWLLALDKIDYSNRIPRGMRYARNGSVLDIDIKELIRRTDLEEETINEIFKVLNAEFEDEEGA